MGKLLSKWPANAAPILYLIWVGVCIAKAFSFNVQADNLFWAWLLALSTAPLGIVFFAAALYSMLFGVDKEATVLIFVGLGVINAVLLHLFIQRLRRRPT